VGSAHTCPICGKTMATAGGLEVHQELAHAPVPVAAVAPALPVVGLEEAAGVRHSRGSAGGDPGVRLFAVLIVIVLVAGIVAAVQRSASPAQALDTIRGAATKTAAASTAKVSMSFKTDSGPFAGGISEDGAFDFGARRGRLEVDASSFGVRQISGRIEAVADYASGFVIYMHFPQLARQFGGKQWLKIDFNEVAKQVGIDVDFNSLLQQQSNDPTSGLRMLRGAQEVTTVGAEQVRGVDTTHYRLVVDLNKAVEQAPAESRDAMRKLADLYTVKTFPAEAWLDADGRVRRYETTIDTSTLRLPASLQASNPFKGKLSLHMELYDFGAPVDVQLPPANQVADLAELIREGR